MMDHKTFLSLASQLLLALLLTFPVSAQAPPPERSEVALEMHLKSQGQTTVEQTSRQPVLLEISLSNPLAQNIQLSNLYARNLLKEHSQHQEKVSAEELKELAEFGREQPVPAIQLGSVTAPINRLISFVVTDASHKGIVIRIRPLASASRVQGKVVLDGTKSLHFMYGIDPVTLAAIPNGTYLIQADLNTLNQADMWQGKVSSNTVKLILAPVIKPLSPQDAEQSDYILGRFYLLDQQYDQVEAVASRLLAANPKSISAWELRGDAAAGKGKFIEASAAYRQALKFHALQAQDKKLGTLSKRLRTEPPLYLWKQLEQVLSHQKHNN